MSQHQNHPGDSLKLTALLRVSDSVDMVSPQTDQALASPQVMLRDHTVRTTVSSV